MKPDQAGSSSAPRASGAAEGQRLARLRESFLHLGRDSDQNVSRLVALCGELLGACCALYNCLRDGRLVTVGAWNAPAGYRTEDAPEGHLCYEVIRRGGEEPLVVRQLPQTDYARTDPNVLAYGLQTYVGQPVRCGPEQFGSLCVVFQTDFEPRPDDLALLGIVASAIGLEEEHRRAEAGLRASEERLRILFELAPDTYFLIDLTGTLIDGNQAAENISGYTRRELMGRNLLQLNLLAADQLPKAAALLARNALGLATGPEEFTLTRKDGRPVKIEIRGYPVKMAGRTCVLVIGRDISLRKDAEAQLLAYQGQLRSLAARLATAEDQERGRLAADLHDNIGQSLALAKIRLNFALRSAKGTALARPIEEVCDLVDQMTREARTLAFQLSPSLLYDLGFEAAAEWLVEQIQEQHGIPISLETRGTPGTVPGGGEGNGALGQDVAGLLFRGLRELLLNVVKHARAGKVRVTIERRPEDIRVRVEDDGAGFNVEPELSHPGRGGGFGLFNLRERLGYIGGRLEIDSGPGRGTRATMVAPPGGGGKEGLTV